MSLVLVDLEEYIYIIWRFIQNRKKLQIIDKQDYHFRWLGQDKKVFPQHPAETEITNALKIDTKSLFLFGVIVVNKSLLLIEKYLPDKTNSQYTGISNFYDYLISDPLKSKKSNLCEKLKNELFNEIKFFRGPLCIFRNKFIQHIEKGYQTGFTHGWTSNDFSLTFHGWDIDNSMQNKINLFRQKINSYKIMLFDIKDDAKFIQTVYDNIEKIPDNLVGDVANLITFTGVHSLHPYQLIDKIETYYLKLFKFFINNLNTSELIKYKK